MIVAQDQQHNWSEYLKSFRSQQYSIEVTHDDPLELEELSAGGLSREGRASR